MAYIMLGARTTTICIFSCSYPDKVEVKHKDVQTELTVEIKNQLVQTETITLEQGTLK